MKLSGVVTLVVSVSAILSCGPGVPTQDSASAYKTEAITATDGNKSMITPVTNANVMGLNPAHGQPGHRCDIPVGQPLNSKPARQPSGVINPVTVATSPATSPTTAPLINLGPTTQSIAALNPPHGQPGHRCDIPVGKPLNSKPPITTQTTTPLPTITPKTNAITVAPGMNPPHGQPGHRCDIPVGKPLNSKPPQASLPTTPTTPLNNPASATKDSTNN
jgi:hypothetical protein